MCWPRGWWTEAAELAELVDGDWSDAGSWETALGVTRGFLDYWEANRAVFRVVDLATGKATTPCAACASAPSTR